MDYNIILCHLYLKFKRVFHILFYKVGLTATINVYKIICDFIIFKKMSEVILYIAILSVFLQFEIL